MMHLGRKVGQFIGTLMEMLLLLTTTSIESLYTVKVKISRKIFSMLSICDACIHKLLLHGNIKLIFLSTSPQNKTEMNFLLYLPKLV